MFQKNLSYFPTLREIRDQLVQAQINKINNDSRNYYSKKTNFKMLARTYAEKWLLLFEMANLGDLDKPLTRKILSNPEHKITKHIIYLYTMECFIY